MAEKQSETLVYKIFEARKLPILSEDKGCWNGGLSASGVVSHGNEQLIVVLVLICDNDPHRPGLLSPDHLGDEAALAPLDQGDLALDHVGVGDVATATAGLGWDQLDVVVAVVPAGGKHSWIGLGKNYKHLKIMSP